MNPIYRSPFVYDSYESLSKGFEWIGATAKAFWRNPVFARDFTGSAALMAAWGEVTERAFSRVQMQPSWGIDSTIISDKEYVVDIETEIDKPFGRLTRFHIKRKKPQERKILIMAPLSGHYATLVRKTVKSLLPHSDVYVTEWKNARNVPISFGRFDIEDYTQYLVEYMKHLGPDLNIIAICQPCPLALAATAMLAEDEKAHQPKTLTLIGGPVDPVPPQQMLPDSVTG